MDNSISQPLATESYSYRWLVTTTEPSSSKTEHNNNNNIVMSNSNNNNNNSLLLLAAEASTQSFDFDLSTTTIMANTSFVYADKLFFNGVIKPQSLDDTHSWKPAYNNNNGHGSSSPLSISSLPSSPLVYDYSNDDSEVNECPIEKEFQGIIHSTCWSKLISMRIISKYVSCLLPGKLGMKSEKMRVDDLNRRRSLEVKANSCSPQNNNNNNNNNNNASPSVGVGVRRQRSASAWTDSDDTSIHEAILYCKQSSA